MRIKNKYLRNRCFRLKHWKRIRNAEHPYKTYMPWFDENGFYGNSAEEQINNNFDWIKKQSRHLESGSPHSGHYNAASWFRRQLNSERRAQERNALNKIRQGDYDMEIPTFKHDANWLWF